MHLSENEGIENKTFVVTGGLGFVGSALCFELVRRGARHVRAFDLRPDSPWSNDLRHKGVSCIQGDVSNKQDVEKALRGADCVFHLASYGMSGKEMLQYARADEVNMKGTLHVLEACSEHGVERLVYVSTQNVVFGGKEIINGNETFPYFPGDANDDVYGRSKTIAEKLVLKGNGLPFKNGNGKLYSCAIRPGAIYGPGEERHFPRIVKLAKLGLLLFKIGHGNVRSDWVYVDNLVSGLLLASMGLLDDIPGREGPPVAAGQAYFISDDCPVNSFEFMRPLLTGLDYDLPSLTLSVNEALMIGNFFKFLYYGMYPWLSHKWLPHPLILPTEVYKVGVTHHFSILKARQELGYRPLVSPQEGMAATVTYWKDRKRRSLDGPTIYTWSFAVIGMLMLFCAAYLPDDFGPAPLCKAVSLFFLRSIHTLRAVFLVSVALHVAEAAYAWNLARKFDPANASGWFWQTLALGFFSLRYLLKRVKVPEHRL